MARETVSHYCTHDSAHAEKLPFLPGAMLLAAGLLAVAAAFSDNRAYLLVVFGTGMLGAVAGGVRVPRFLLFLLGAVVLVAAPLAVFTAWRGNLPLAELLLLRTLAAMSVLGVAARMLGAQGVIGALQALGAPRGLVSVLTITVSQLQVLARIGQQMMLARNARTAVAQAAWREAAAVGTNGAVLLWKSLQQSDEVHAAMLARGFSGQLAKAKAPQYAVADLILFGSAGLLATWGLLV